MKVRDVMTRQVVTASPNDTVQAVARLMADIDSGALPIEAPGVGTLVGFITDRDIITRVVAEGLPTTTPVSEIMTVGIESCTEDEALEDIARRMESLQLRRLVVYGHERDVTGFISDADLPHALRAHSNPTEAEHG